MNAIVVWKRGRRTMKATDCDGNAVWIPYDDACSEDENFKSAAIAICKAKGWGGTLAMGEMPNGRRVFVWLTGKNHFPC